MSRFGKCSKSSILSNTRPLTQGRLKACQDLVFRSSACEGIFHGPLDSSKRPSTTSKRFAVVQKAIGTRSAIANKMCLFHLLRQKAITAIFWKRASMAKDAPGKHHSITSRAVVCEKSWLEWRGVSSRPRDSSDTFRKFKANSSSIALKVPIREVKVLAVWPSIAEGFTTACSRVTIYTMKNCQTGTVLWARCSTSSLCIYGRYLMSLLAETKRRVMPATNFAHVFDSFSL